MDNTTKLKPNNSALPAPHKYSKILLAVTVVVVISAVSAIGYYLYKIKTLKKNVAVMTEAPAVTDSTTPEVPAVATTLPAANTTATTTAAAEIKTAVASVDLSGVKQAVADLKSSLSSFNK